MGLATKADVYAAIGLERAYQDVKWGSIEKHPHGLGGWLAIMQSELAEASEALLLHEDEDDALREILQVIASGVAALEQHGLVEREDFGAMGRHRVNPPGGAP